jgi:hypothetical protein
MSGAGEGAIKNVGFRLFNSFDYNQMESGADEKRVKKNQFVSGTDEYELICINLQMKVISMILSSVVFCFKNIFLVVLELFF